MSESDLPPAVRRSLSEVISLCNQHNIPEKNLRDDEFVPSEIGSAYSDLRDAVDDHPNISWIKTQRFIAKHIDINLDAESKFYLWDLAVTQKRNIVVDNYPEIEGKIENGLIQVPMAAEMNKNGFEYKDHFLIFDSRFSQNYRLVGHLDAARSDDVDVYAPLTLHQLGDPDTTRRMMLKEHWAGPQTVDRLQKRRAPEFIQKGTESYQDGLMDRTEFFFDTRDGEWHVQIEELMPYTGIRYSPDTTFRGEKLKFYTRYVHAILGPDCEHCYHLDGAFRTYGTKDEFLKRHTEVDLRQPNELKEMSGRHKLFKIESLDQGLTDYQEIIGLFFKHNPHVMEFFEGESEETRQLEQRRTQLFRSAFESDHVDVF